jgi:hypothetical protein
MSTNGLILPPRSSPPPIVDTSSEAVASDQETSVAPLTAPLVLVVGGLVLAALRHGAFYNGELLAVEVVFGVAVGTVVLTGVVRRARPSFATGRPALTATALVAAATVVTGLATHRLNGAIPAVGLMACVAALVGVVRPVRVEVQRTLLAAVSTVGAGLAATGWWGVATHRWPWSLVDGGLWRAASTVTYANGTGAVLVALALVGAAQIALRRSVVWSMLTTALLIGAGATLSRAAGAGFVVGLVALVLTIGPRSLHRLWPSIVGAGVALAGLAPSFIAVKGGAPAPAHTAWAILSALIGLGIATAFGRSETERSARNWERARVPVVVFIVIATFLLAAAGRGSGVTADRISLRSPDRIREWRGSWDLLVGHPLVGIGPGPFTVSWTAPDGVTMSVGYTHNEYLQLGAQEGVIGLAAAAAAVGVVALSVWRRRPTRAQSQARANWAGAVAGLAALAVQSSLDFLWHIPLIPLVGAVLAGVALARPRPMEELA